jgi:F0F1-type ATP synthase membrane subunit b/b'
MLVSNELLIVLIISLAVVTLVNPLILLEGFAKLLRRQKKGLSRARETEREILSYHQKSVEKMEKQIQTEVRAELAKIAAQHSETLAKLNTGEEIHNATEKYLRDTKTALDGLVGRAAKKVDEELNQDLAAARAEISRYKERRLQKIDEEILTIVEKTIYKTLGKGLSLEDHLDLIYESLAEAKAEGFFEKNA